MSYGLRKYVITGNIIEVYEYSKNVKGKGGAKERGKSPEDIKMINYINHTLRRRNNIRRLACANFSNMDKFITFTFKENLQDLKQANLIFKNFIKRLKYYLNDFEIKYLAVIEFQSRGAIHYHTLMNIPYIKWEKILELWRSRFCRY